MASNSHSSPAWPTDAIPPSVLSLLNGHSLFLIASFAESGISVVKHCLSSVMMQSRWRARTYNLIYWTQSFTIQLLFSPIQYQEETSQRCHSETFISQPCITPVNAPRSWRKRCLIHPCSASNSQRYHFWQTLDVSIPLWLVRIYIWFISYIKFLLLMTLPHSFSWNENGTKDIPSGSFVTEIRWQCTRRTSN